MFSVCWVLIRTWKIDPRGRAQTSCNHSPSPSVVKAHHYLLLPPLFLLFRAIPTACSMEVPRLGVESGLQLQAYPTATATPDLSCICDLHHSLWQCWIPNSLSRARDGTHVLMDTSWVRYHWATVGTPIRNSLTCWVISCLGEVKDGTEEAWESGMSLRFAMPSLSWQLVWLYLWGYAELTLQNRNSVLSLMWVRCFFPRIYKHPFGSYRWPGVLPCSEHFSRKRIGLMCEGLKE